jgi:hypothetical protein
MARNPAVRKAAKAAKRKAMVAAKRKLEIAANTPAARIRQAAGLPVMNCLLSAGLFEAGIGVAILIRGVSREEQNVASFMLDSFCLGVKDVFYRTVDRQEADHMLQVWHRAETLEPAEPAEVRKLLRDLVAWSGANGFPPHEDYVPVDTLFGNVMPAETDYTPKFGHEGNVLYIPGPSESPLQVRRRTEIVRSRFGEKAVSAGRFSLGDLLEDEDDFEDDDIPEGALLPAET